jgi:hypothetical protein
MHINRLAIQGMPRIVNFADFVVEGIVLRSSIMKKEIIKAKRITCCFLGRLNRWRVIRDRFNVRND